MVGPSLTWANQDSEKVARSINIKNYSNWSFDDEGFTSMMKKESAARKKFYERVSRHQDSSSMDQNYLSDDLYFDDGKKIMF